MIYTLLKRRIDEAKWLLAACSIAMIWFCWVRVWLVSRIDTSRFQEILDLLPSDWQRLISVDVAWLITYEGRIAVAYDELIVFGSVLLWAVARGSDCVSGELGRGTMEMLLAQPLSRLTVLSSQASVTLVGVAVLAFAAWFGTWLGIQTTTVEREVTASWQLPIPLPGLGSEIPIPFAERKTEQVSMSALVDARLYVPASVSLFAFGAMIAGFTTLMSSWDRYRWRTIGIVVALFVVQIIAKLVGMAVEELTWLKYLSAFTAYEPEAFVHIADQMPEFTWSFGVYDVDGNWIGFGPLANHLTMGMIGLVCYAGAAVIFRRRDLPAPL
jgi:ABC-2 type transport system permease protein